MLNREEVDERTLGRKLRLLFVGFPAAENAATKVVWVLLPPRGLNRPNALDRMVTITILVDNLSRDRTELESPSMLRQQLTLRAHD